MIPPNPPEKFKVNNGQNQHFSEHIFRMRNYYPFGPLDTCHEKDTDITLFLVVYEF